jgi:hypothetical protein
MNRALFVVMVAAVSMGMIGCAVGEEDPLEPEPAPEGQREAPKVALNDQLRNPQGLQLVSGLEIRRGVDNEILKQAPPAPPIPNPPVPQQE